MVNVQISVIIPVFNAERYLQKAVESALIQGETGEVLLVEDNSPDGSLEICKQLVRDNSKVKLYRHADGKNHGAGATRNLGIKKAQCEFVAFLDADDYYLPNRFKTARQCFEDDANCDGVYEAIGMHFYDQEGKGRWIAQGGEMLTTLQECVEPKLLFEHLLDKKKGYLHLDGLVLKKNLFKKCGYFPEHLKLHQDTALIYQVAAFGRLMPGRLAEPVALRGIHAENRITQNKDKLASKYLLWETLFEWAFSKQLSWKRLTLLYRRHIESSYRLAKHNGKFQNGRWQRIKFIVNKLLDHPALFSAAAISMIYDRAWK